MLSSALLEAREDLKKELDSQQRSLQEACESLRSELATHTRCVEGRLAEHRSFCEDHSSLDLSASTGDQHYAECVGIVTDLTKQVDGLRSSLAKESQKLSDEFHAKHSNLNDLMMSINDEYHAQHMRTVTDLTKQMEDLRSVLTKEAGLHVQEEQLGKACDELRSHVDIALQEQCSALQTEFADHKQISRSIMSAIQKDHETLKSELTDYSRNLQQDFSKHHAVHNGHTRLIEEYEPKDFSELQHKPDAHYAKHFNLDGWMNSICDEHPAKNVALVMELKMQVDRLRSSLTEESGLRIQMEDRLGKAHDELRGEIEVTVHQQHTALQAEFAEQSKCKVTTGIQEPCAVTQSELAIYRKGLETKLDACCALHEENAVLMIKSEQRMHKEWEELSEDHGMKLADIKSQMRAINDECHARHTKTEEACVEGLQSVVRSTSSKLKEEIGVMTDLTKQVDQLTSSFAEESGLRLDCEKRLGQACAELRTDLENAIRETNVTLQGDYAALQSELTRYQSELDDKLSEHDAQHNDHTFAIQELQRASNEHPAFQAEMKARRVAEPGISSGSSTTAPEDNLEEKSWAKAMQAFNSAEAMAKKIAKAQSQPILGTESLLKVQPDCLPSATVGVDTIRDGNSNFYHTGIDMDKNGIPDALRRVQGRAAPRNAVAGVQIQQSSPARLRTSIATLRGPSVLPGATPMRRIS
mmetsp:Transcript_50098/g.92020  ORF Transcript_50098/g.92020 Transcript_50098/m.92020 type:complete len:699 (-) Transcript_50098:65-2161(-)